MIPPGSPISDPRNKNLRRGRFVTGDVETRICADPEPRARMKKVTVLYLLELVAALAVGMALARPVFQIRQASGEIVGAALTGVALIEGLAVWLEAARRRGPPAWGFGRATWSIAGGASVFYIIFNGLHSALGTPGWSSPLPFLRELIIGTKFYYGYPVWRLMPWCLPAFYFTLRLAGWPRGSAPDGREWAGRLYAILVVGLYFASYEFDLIDLDAIIEKWHR